MVEISEPVVMSSMQHAVLICTLVYLESTLKLASLADISVNSGS